jgi:putative membrane protein insertion efficiency factor
MKFVSYVIVFILKLPIWIWQWFISPVLGTNCRYTPSCSRYACQALNKHGATKGSWLAFRRILSCNPWGGSGSDSVPDTCEHAAKQHLKPEHGISVSHPGA